MQYWVHIGGLQRGPMTLDELIGLGITRETYVWRVGLKDWVQAKDLDELSGYFNIPETVGGESSSTIKDPDVEPKGERQNQDDIETADTDGETEQQAPIEENVGNDEKSNEPESVADEKDKESITESGTTKPEEQIPEIEPERNQDVKDVKDSGQTVPPPVPDMPWPTGQDKKWQPAPECPPTNLVWAIIATVLCCQILGIVAIIYAAQVESKYRMGQYDLAQKYSDRAAIWCMVSFAAGLVYVPIAIIVAML